MRVDALVAGKYRILRKIGEGGMGSVWLARNEVTERELAIKFLHSGAKNPDLFNRFFQEARVASKLRHPAVVEIFDAGTEPALDHAPYLVMELLDGVGLDEAIVRSGGLPLGIALEIMGEVARALALAHQRGIIHRDLKPSNVYLHRVGSGAVVPKILDFGISKVLGDSDPRTATGMTRTGAILGSPLYMSPEQAASDKTIDARSDVHALGVMLWECLVGKPPFTAESYGLLMVAIISGDRPRLADAAPGVPASVAALVTRAMARDRNERFADAGEFAAAVEAELAKLEHTPVLGTRTGAAHFFDLVVKPAGAHTDDGTTTTAAVSLPSAGIEASPAAARSAEATDLPRTAPMQAAPVAVPISTESVTLPTRRSPLLGAAIAAGVLGLAVAGYFALRPASTAATGAETPPAGPGLASAEPAAPGSTTPPANAEATLRPELAAEAPDAAGPAPSASVAVRAKPTGKPALPAKPGPAPKPAASSKPKPAGGAPVHHGVTSSGL